MKLFEQLSKEQLDCIDFIDEGEDSLIAADVGTGKTVMSMTAAARDAETRWLVLAPLLVAVDTWANEYKEWDHLQGLEVAIACGNSDQRMQAIEQGAQFTVMNYENLAWLMEQFPKKSGKPDPLPFNGLICDEIDKLKSVSSNRFKLFRNRVKVFNRRIGLTGTLLPNHMTELWGQVYMVDGGETFGRSFYEWRKQYFYPTDFNQHNWAPFERTQELLLNEIGDLAYRVEATDQPEVVFTEPEYVELPTEVRAKYDELDKKFMTLVHKTSGDQKVVDAKSAGVLAGKLQQMTSGFLYTEKGSKEPEWFTDAKFRWLQHMVYDKLRDEQVMILYHYKSELEQINRHVPGHFTLGGDTPKSQAQKIIRDWNEGHIRALAIHPAAAGHGLNLQKSGAHHILAMKYQWSGGLMRQVIGRLARRGNPADKVFVHSCLFEDTVDEDIFETVQGKLDELDEFLRLI